MFEDGAKQCETKDSTGCNLFGRRLPFYQHGVRNGGIYSVFSGVIEKLLITTRLAVLKRDKEDARTIGELFFLTVSEVAEMTYRESLLILPAAMLTSM